MFQKITIPHTIPKNIENLILVMLFCYGLYYEAVFSVGIPNFAKPLFLLVGFGILVWAIYTNKPPAYQIKAIIGICFLGIELVILTLPIIILPQILYSQKKIKFQTPHLFVFIYLLFCLISIVIYTIIDFSLFTPFFWYILAGAQFVLFLHYYRYNYQVEDILSILHFFKKLILLQIIILALQLFIHRNPLPGDHWLGSLDADKTGLYLFLILLYYLLPPFLLKNTNLLKLKSFRALLVLSLFVCSILCDAKMILAITSIGTIIYITILVFSQLFSKIRQTSFDKTILSIFLIIVCSSFAIGIVNYYLSKLSSGGVTNVINVFNFYSKSSINTHYNGVVNAKAVLYQRTYKQWYKDDKLSWFFGAGPGRFNGRASNMLAYDVLYKEKGQFKLPKKIPPYSSYWVKKYMGDLWTKESAEAIQWSSANLSFPFAGLIAIKGEMGVIGLILFILFVIANTYALNKKLQTIPELNIQRWIIVLSIFWTSLPLLMIIDNIQEKPQIMLPMLLLTTIILKLKPKTLNTGR